MQNYPQFFFLFLFPLSPGNFKKATSFVEVQNKFEVAEVVNETTQEKTTDIIPKQKGQTINNFESFSFKSNLT